MVCFINSDPHAHTIYHVEASNCELETSVKPKDLYMCAFNGNFEWMKNIIHLEDVYHCSLGERGLPPGMFMYNDPNRSVYYVRMADRYIRRLSP